VAGETRASVGILVFVSVPGLKEWAVVVRALLEGEQILDVRKGGVREEGRHFAVRSERCWLYPTVEHQRPELVKPAYRRWVAETEAAAPPDRAVRIDGWAEVVGVTTVADPEAVQQLDSRVVWTPEYLSSRLGWKRRDPLWILALRAYHLEEPVTVQFRDEYGRCTSWVDLDGLPADPRVLAAEPALSDESFAARVRLAAQALGRPFDTAVA
jgi:hypothetical protein